MSCSCNGNCELVQIEPIVLSDTFHTWYDRTNEVISTLNNLNIYDINVGTTDSGLTSITNCSNGDYNGVVTLKVARGPGIGVGSGSYYPNKTLIDVSGLTHYGSTGYDAHLPTAFPANDDWFIMSDQSDTSLGTGYGTPKRINAQQILPPTVYLPSGFQFNGNVSINGNLSIQGSQTVIDTSQVLIEDKTIKLAYRRFVAVDVTGPTSSTFPAAGMTFNYYDYGVGSTANPTTVGKISSVSYLSGGKTNLILNNFTVGGVSDIAPLGRLSITGTIFDFTMVAGPTVSESFYSDDNLDESGIIVRGASGDKVFEWVYKEGPVQDLYNSFVSSCNLGVSGSSNAIIASKFRSYGYNDSNDNTFQFMGYKSTARPKIILGGGTGDSIANQFGYWGIKHDNGGGTTTQQPLVWSFKPYATGTESTLFTIWSGASGPTFDTVTVGSQGNNRVANFASGLNVDFLDGAHGTTNPTSFSVPIALTGGYLAPGWIDPSALKAITRCFTQSVMGDVVRINIDGSGLTYAYADYETTAEALGVVSSVDGNTVCVVTEGYITGLTGTSTSKIGSLLNSEGGLQTGKVYSLKATRPTATSSTNDGTPGAMYRNDSTSSYINYKPSSGQFLKPIMLAVSADTGYVLNYPSMVNGFVPTDLVEGIESVGTILPYTGLVAPAGFLMCDGSRQLIESYNDLYQVIGQKYYHRATLVNTGTNGTIYLESNVPGVGVDYNDKLTIVFDSGDILSDVVVSGISTGSFTISSASLPDLGYNNETSHICKIYGRENIFFLPDLRTRTLIGAITQTSGTFRGLYASEYQLGSIAGLTSNEMSVFSIPSHYHSVKNVYITTPATVSNTYAAGLTHVARGFEANPTTRASEGASNTTEWRRTSKGPDDAADTYSTGNPLISNIPPSVAVNWIIRYQRKLSALILTGHNHDDRYHPLNGDMKLAYKGSYANTIGTKGLSGFNVYAAGGVIDETYGGTSYIMSVVANGPFDFPGLNTSRTQTYIRGDLTVMGNGITSNDWSLTGHTASAFSVSPLLNTVSIGSAGSSFRNNPSLKFYDNSGVLGKGTIAGLTAPSDDNSAANKWYVDTTATRLSAPANRYATSGVTGVAMFNSTDFSVSNGNVSFIGNRIILTNTVSTKEFQVRTSDNVSVFTNNNNDKAILTSFVNNTPAAENSSREAYIYGDLTVYGDGSTNYSGGTRLAHEQVMFAVDSVLNRVTITGKQNGRGTSSPTPAPSLVFSPSNQGTIEGLALPTTDYQAANKKYVDDKLGITEYFEKTTTATTGIAFPYTQSNLTPGLWFVSVLATTKNGSGGGVMTSQIDVVASASKTVYVHDSNLPDGTAPVTFNTIAQVGSDGKITIQTPVGIEGPRFYSFMGYRIASSGTNKT